MTEDGVSYLFSTMLILEKKTTYQFFFFAGWVAYENQQRGVENVDESDDPQHPVI